MLIVISNYTNFFEIFVVYVVISCSPSFFLNMYQNTIICFTYQAYKATGVDFDTTAILGAVFSRRSSVNFTI